MGSEMVMGRLASTCRRLFFSIPSLTRLWPPVLTEFADIQMQRWPTHCKPTRTTRCVPLSYWSTTTHRRTTRIPRRSYGRRKGLSFALILFLHSLLLKVPFLLKGYYICPWGHGLYLSFQGHITSSLCYLSTNWGWKEYTNGMIDWQVKCSFQLVAKLVS